MKVPSRRPSRVCARVRMGIAVLAFGLVTTACRAAPEEEVRATFDRFVAVQNAHDINGLEGMLAESPELLWITRGLTIRGRAAALARFAKLYEGTWRLEPDLAALRVTVLSENVAQLHVPVLFATGASGQPPTLTRMFLNQILVKSGGAWRVVSIFPVPGPAQ